MILPSERFAPNVAICHKCADLVVPGCACMADMVSINHHANAGYCPLAKFPDNAEKPDVWDELERQQTGLPFTPKTPAAEIVPHLDSDLPGDAWTKWENVREAYRLAMADFVAAPMPEYHGEGRGIVIAAGGNYLTSGYVTVRLLRHHGCTLPIEWVYAPGEMPDWQRKLLDGLDVKFVAAPCGGFQMKTWAILNSAFEHVLFLDADCEPLRDPTFLFNSEAFAKFGAIFWPDNVERSDYKTEAANPPKEVWDALGIEYRADDWDFESGQIVIDRRRCWKEINLADWMSRIHSRYYYTMGWGDKTVFHLAWRYLETDYAMPAHNWDGGKPAMIQHDPTTVEPVWLFAHQSAGKRCIKIHGKRWKERDPDPRLPEHDALCEKFVADLQTAYDAVKNRLHGLTVCVDFGDRLEKTLPENIKHFASYTVVTIERDTETQAIARRCGAHVLITHSLYQRGAKFDKGLAINDALRQLYEEHPDEWMCHIDADVVLPADLKIQLAGAKLSPDCIYGMRREGNSLKERWNNPISGFFQLWHASVRRFYRSHIDAGFSDIWFRDEWPKEKQIVLPLVAKHLGEPGRDWGGRVTPRLGENLVISRDIGFGDTLLSATFAAILRDNDIPCLWWNHDANMRSLIDLPQWDGRSPAQHYIFEYESFNPGDRNFLRRALDLFSIRNNIRHPIKIKRSTPPLKIVDDPSVLGADVAICLSGGNWSPYRYYPKPEELKQALTAAGLTFIDVKNLWNHSAFSAIRKSRLYLGIDTGATHAASALNKNGIVLQSGFNRAEDWNHDYGFEILTADSACTLAPCYLREGCPHNHRCMEIPVARIVERVIARLKDIPALPPVTAPPLSIRKQSAPAFDGRALWSEINALVFLPDLSEVPARLPAILAKLPHFGCSCRPDAAAYLKQHPPDLSSPAALARWIWTWHDTINAKLGKPRPDFDACAAKHGWPE